MLLHSYKITRILPCLADPEKIRVIAEISDEIHEAFPYLNATLKGCICNPIYSRNVQRSIIHTGDK